MKHIVFYCHTNIQDLYTFEYYLQDIEALEALGNKVTVVNHITKIPKNYDIIFIWWWTYALAPVFLAKLFFKKSIVTGTFNFKHHQEEKSYDYFSRPWWQRILIYSATRLTNLNIFVNKEELDACSDYFKLKKAAYIPHVLSDKYLLGPSEERNLCLLNISWSGEKNLDRKGIFDLLDAIKIIRVKHPAIRLILAGKEGSGKEKLIQYIDKLGLKNNVNYIGSVSLNEKIKLLRTSEIYIQPSYYEGFGLAIAEAMGCGACIITTPVGGIPNVVGDTAIFVTPGCPELLAEKIDLLLTDNKLRLSLQKKTFLRAKENFQFQTKLNTLKKLLDEI